MYFKRKLEAKIRKNVKNNKAIIVTGMRRTGKTSLLKEIYNGMPDNKVWFDFENPINIKHFEDIDYNDVYENIINYGDLDKSKKVYVFIDEIQHHGEASKIVKYLIDHKNIKFFLTGSASYYLKNLFPESLAGRKVILELFPLDFEEYLLFKGINIEKYLRVKRKKNIKLLDYEMHDKLYEEYLNWGGFPEVALEDNQKIKTELLNDIFSSYFQNEIVNLADYRKNDKVRDLILLLAARVGSQLDIVKISQELGISRSTVYSYLSFLEATYFIHLISPYSKSIDREISGTQKVYFCDNGILSIMAKLNFGQQFENAVYNQLKTKNSLNYYRKRTGAEIDFIFDKKIAYEVKATATRSDSLDLSRKIKLINLKKSFIISHKYVKGVSNVVYGQFL